MITMAHPALPDEPGERSFPGPHADLARDGIGCLAAAESAAGGRTGDLATLRPRPVPERSTRGWTTDTSPDTKWIRSTLRALKGGGHAASPVDEHRHRLRCGPPASRVRAPNPCPP